MSRVARAVESSDLEKRIGENRARAAQAASEEELARARAQLENEERARADAEQNAVDLKEMNAAIKRRLALPVKLRPHLQEIRRLYRLLDDAVDAMAGPVVEALRDVDEATLRGRRQQQVHVVERQVSKPTMAEVALLSRVMIARDREERKSDLRAESWIAAAVEPAPHTPEHAAWKAAVAIIEQLERFQ